MAAEPNLIDVKALGEAKSIDFANRMGIGLNKLFEALSITNKIPMNVGSAIKQYRFKIVDSTAPDGNVAEGDIIPLTKVEREQVKITELKFKKYRKSTSAEAIQSHGYDLAINRTDNELLRYVQKNFRKDFFNSLKGALDSADRTNKAALTGKNLQGALAKGRANLSTLLDDEITPIALVNPNDVAEHIANGFINSNGAQFGLNLLTPYVGVRVIEFADVPAGEVWMTTAENLNVAFANPRGELSRAFAFATDETGFVGVLHDIQPERLTADTVFASAISMFPENIDAVVKVTIKAETAPVV
ncbi:MULTISPECIES: capsid protein [Staphylococcus]|uniref:Major head protein n=1 Tax=Staphylococcus phage HS06 TaxID=3056400 RepID=A0AA49X286_9VIRU|nr:MULTISPECIES: capsid protein [Staphylococcus]WLJ25662.1 MAG: major head protein [Staphylococcus phage HS06]ARJ30533.1 capsid protein [Staphylococcus lugdunensis]MCH8664232.1 capsid protein [Staphylococcus lugdunensis]MCM3468213.1 capsid protein [Staphylococcus lugdunensis]MDU1964157.1 capsid protein [Staphylococcus lugdunensis]